MKGTAHGDPPDIQASAVDAAYGRVLCSPRQALGQVERIEQDPAAATSIAARAGCALVRGRAFIYQGSFDEAARFLEQARVLYQQAADPMGLARCDHGDGSRLRFLGQAAAAREALERAAAAFHRLGAAADEADCARDLTGLFASCGDQAAARAYLARAQDYWRDNAPPQHYLLGRGVEGLLTMEEGRPVEAGAILRETRIALAELDCPVGEAICGFEEGRTLEEQARFAEARGLYTQARLLFEQEGMPHRSAHCEKNIGLTWMREGQYERALAPQEQAAETFRRLGMVGDEAACLLNQGMALFLLNRFGESYDRYDRALARYRQTNRGPGIARALLNQGLIHQIWGEYARAMDLERQAADLFAQFRSQSELATSWENLAELYGIFGEQGQSLELYHAAENIYRQAQMPVGAARCILGRGRVLGWKGDHPAAASALEQAVAQFHGLGLPLREAAGLVEMGDLAQKTDPAAARAAYQQARTHFAAQGIALDTARCDLGLAEVALIEEGPNQAQPLFQQALNVVIETFPDLAWRAHAGLARCAQENGRQQDALALFLQAVESIRRARSWVPGEAWSGAFFAHREWVYRQALELAAALGDGAAGLQVCESARAQALLSLLRAEDRIALLPDEEGPALEREIAGLRWELRSQSGAECRLTSEQTTASLARLAERMARYERVGQQRWAAWRTRTLRGWTAPFDLEAFRRAARTCWPPGWQALVYELGEELTILLVDPTVVKVWRRPLAARERDTLELYTSPDPGARRFLYRGGREDGQPHPGMERDLQRLYRLLIPAEVAAQLSPERLLFLVPHGAMHALPLAALLGPQGYLVQHSTLVHLPSLQALGLLAQRRPTTGGTCSDERPALLLGVSQFDGRWPDLPHVPAELARLARAWGGQARVASEATRSEFAGLAEELAGSAAGLLHLSTHAAVDEQRTWGTRIALRDQDLVLGDLLEAGIGARTVVLGTCRGAVSQRYSGEEMTGLAWVFFALGAAGLVGNLWDVDDAGGLELLVLLHEGLARGARPAAALAQAQRALLAQGYPPYDWAGFVALGTP